MVEKIFMPTKGVDRAAMREAILRRYRELKQRNPTADCFRQAVVETIPKGALAGYHKILEWMSELRQALQKGPLAVVTTATATTISGGSGSPTRWAATGRSTSARSRGRAAANRSTSRK